ncbi:MAG: acyl-CoA dehydrogenase family protein [Anaerolineae bacterium]|nr:acyl-CoA dehydrogenase family protein [Anaerolineae bacterium]
MSLKFKRTSTQTSPQNAPINPAHDFCNLDGLLTPDERAVRDKARAFAETEIRPIIADYWERDETPFALLPKLAALNLAGGTIKGYDCPGLSAVAAGLVSMELTRGDGSVATLFGVHSGLAMYSIAFLGNDEQKQRWLPAMAKMEKFGAFGLTEPNVGSAASTIQTTARKDGDFYVLNGAKRWIGGATFADVVGIYAQDDQTGQISGFLVEKGTPGFTATKIQHKLALRALPNADIKLENCIVPASNKLGNCHSFKDLARVLVATRLGVAWGAIGNAQAAYEYALAYAKQRQQWGRPIAGFQMIQDKLVRMLADLEAMKIMTWRLSALADQGQLTDAQASLAKMHNAAKSREIVALAREIMGGNGILIDNHVARHFADAEAVYSYEGTNEVNTLVVGREITGVQAFV